MASKELEKIIGLLRSQPVEADLPPEELRAVFEKLASMFPIPSDLHVERVDAGGVPGGWLSVPDGSDDRVILFLHGGGYVIGSIQTHRSMIARLSRAAGARTLAIEYRLAPEHPFPAAVEDATAAYRWLLAQDVDPARLVICGDSAGGGLAVATLVSLRDAGETLPAAGVLLSPWTDLAATGDSLTTNAERDPLVQREGLENMARMYLGDADPRTPLASPLYADLDGLPPLLIHAGAAEAILDDSVRLDQRARAAGVESILEVWDDMVHVWHYFADMLPEGRAAIDRIGEFIRERTA